MELMFAQSLQEFSAPEHQQGKWLEYHIHGGTNTEFSLATSITMQGSQSDCRNSGDAPQTSAAANDLISIQKKSHKETLMPTVALEVPYTYILAHPSVVTSVIDGISYTIGLGLQRLSPPYGRGVQMIEANFSVQHPYFNTSSSGSPDLMLIKLSKPAVQSDTVRKIPIVSTCPITGSTCLASAWGRLLDFQYTDALHCTLLRVHSPKTCKAVFGDMYEDSIFCAGGEGNRNSCQGDYGEPFVCHGFLQGIVSSEFNCGQPGLPRVYTNVCKFTCWIDTTIYSSEM
ncbi:kallikrein-4-like [Octodon degus]|uniref:Kallikrein-4-like n=1 Tax=Octodon degus TaxID=10160 RepID=A0A6P6DLX0_OCTDE|nr:kallikrein-4-like [Octodon degus]